MAVGAARDLALLQVVVLALLVVLVSKVSSKMLGIFDRCGGISINLALLLGIEKGMSRSGRIDTLREYLSNLVPPATKGLRASVSTSHNISAAAAMEMSSGGYRQHNRPLSGELFPT